MMNMNINGSPYGTYQNYYNSAPLSMNHSNTADSANNTGKTVFKENDHNKLPGIKNPNEECETCKKRKYQDGSNEGNVSFKAATHIAPEAAASAVRAHEGEHVSNAYKKAKQNNGEVVRADVSIHTSICPECGRSYVSGGTTSTQIRYFNEENPYQQDLKTTDGLKYKGMNVDMIA